MVIKQRVLIVGATGYLGKFIVKELKSLEIVKAKERFAQELKEAGIEYIIIRPNGFFSDMTEFFMTVLAMDMVAPNFKPTLKKGGLTWKEKRYPRVMMICLTLG
jgi:uncharacterized protein YbjT (DUF2867 family)